MSFWYCHCLAGTETILDYYYYFTLFVQADIPHTQVNLTTTLIVLWSFVKWHKHLLHLVSVGHMFDLHTI